ncbi:MAG: oligosaccharide flippase family protein [Sorangiineae bacterium]|nr:oligosaccharide flippase family protein [Polyangiaceae bacterium]MEB2324091.1 oligosaccharide flippase family protein [Sorangiineae bacterium]
MGAEPDASDGLATRGEGSPSATPDRAKQAGVLVLGTALATLSSVIVPLLVVRIVGKADVAALMALLLIYETVSLVVTSGFPQTLMYYLPARPTHERRAVAVQISRTMLALGGFAALILVGVGLLGDALPGLFARSAGEPQVDLRPLVWLALLPVGDLPARILPNLLIAEGQARAASSVGVIKSISMSLATLLPLALGKSVTFVAACISLVGLVQGLLVLYFLRELYARVSPVESPVTVKQLFRFAIPLGATDIVSMLNNGLDRYLILLAFSATAFAEYQAGAWQVPVIVYVPYAVGIAYAPHFVELFKTGRAREALEIWQGSIEKVALIVLPTAAILIVGAEELMELLFTKEYLRAAPVFRMYAILTLGRVAAYGTVIVAAGKPKYVLQAAVLSLASNLLISVPLVMTVGYLGPALGTVLAFIPTLAFYCWCIGRAAGVPATQVFPARRYLRVLAIAVAAGAVAYGFKLEVHGGAALMLLAEVGLVLSVFGALGTAARVITREDWAFVWSWLRLKVLREKAAG